jgi:hypothetical protein
VRTDSRLSQPAGEPGAGRPLWGMTPMQSWSGHERDHLFWNHAGKEFVEVSGVSGLDSPLDGRAYAVLDYDRDGFLDIAVVNANAPLFMLYRNRIGEGSRGRSVAIRFVGGNHTAAPAKGVACRDGYGARVTVGLGDLTLVREHRCGEGFAAQNSATMIVGIGDRAGVASLAVRWPSGAVHRLRDVPAGSLITAYEAPAQSPVGKPFVVAPYVAVRVPDMQPVADASAPRLHEAVRRRIDPTPRPAPRLNLLTTMATWCEACRGELPHIASLRSRFSTGDLAIYGVPVDELESEDGLAAYVARHRPAYRLLSGLPRDGIEAVARAIQDRLVFDVLPASAVTDGSGRLLLVTAGVPTFSELRRLLDGRPR